MKHLPAAICVFLLLAMPTVADAQTEEPASQAEAQSQLEVRADEVVALLNGEGDPVDLFDPTFLAQVPPAQVAAIGRQLMAQFGAALAVESLGTPQGPRSTIAIRMEKAIANGFIGIGSDGRVNELLLQSFDPIDDSAEKIEADLAALPGTVSWWYGPVESGEPVLSGNADMPMPIGSTFKLYVLAALAGEIRTGNLEWEDVIALEGPKSFPSGMLQNWPDNSPVTLHTLASLMISISDNTATDALMAEVGRYDVYATQQESGHADPDLNNPFLTTREMFLLKAGPRERLEAFERGGLATRRGIVEAIEDIPVSRGEVETAFSGGPVALDVEWFASARDLVSLYRYMRDRSDPLAFEIMAINPNMPASVADDWSYAGYKGGSEPGVLNLTWFLTDRDGVDHALILSWRNDEAAVDQTALELIAQRILNLPR